MYGDYGCTCHNGCDDVFKWFLRGNQVNLFKPFEFSLQKKLSLLSSRAERNENLIRVKKGEIDMLVKEVNLIRKEIEVLLKQIRYTEAGS